jgi:2-C-methyl-D-erythritol 4-phosphate cytidylyltransferase
MIYAGILAAGLGVRMHRQDMPKQFLPLGDKPIIIHTLEQFFVHPRVGRVIIVAPETWKQYTEDLTARYDNMGKELFVIAGGVNKTESIGVAVEYIDERWGIRDDDILIAHDAIRPFITQRIINDNIDAAATYGSANTVMRTNDAILVSQDGMHLEEVPDHNRMYAEQTPQTYNLTELKDSIAWASDEGILLKDESELPRLYVQSGHKMRLVRGEYSNMKIINPYDLEVANALLKERAGS